MIQKCTAMRRPNDSVHWYLNELTSRIVAKSGVPSDRYHLGKMILQSLKDDPELVVQIDGATGKSETSASVLERSVRCAVALRNLGLKHGDVMVLMAPNHLDLAIPFYAALYLGIIIAVLDKNIGIEELKDALDIDEPSIVFCQSERTSHVQQALNELKLKSEIITFDKSDNFCTFQDFLDQNSDEKAVGNFMAEDFDSEKTIALLIATSGTTNKSKATAVTHKNFAVDSPYIYGSFWNFPTPTRMALVPSPLQWLTAIMQFVLTPLLRIPRLQSSIPVMTKEHMYHMINTYRPTLLIISPSQMASFVRAEDRDSCDFSCFEHITMGGNVVSQDLIDEVKRLAAPGADVFDIYGMSELCSCAFMGDGSAPGSCGKPIACFQYRLIDVETQRDILEPNVRGELWIKGPGVFLEYYKNAAATQETFAEDRWFKTGDLFYRDKNWNYYFVERIRLLLKYRSYQVSPMELESVIRRHPGVQDVAVTGILDPECGDLPVACVVRRKGYDVTAQEIKDLIKENLSDWNHLRGGVIFLNQIPMTAASKVLRRRLRELALEMERE